MRTRHFLALLALSASAALTGCSTAMFRGADAGVAITDDRRTPGTYVTDEDIGSRTGRMFSEQAPGGSHVIFTSYNRRVLITGQVPDEATKTLAATVAGKHPDARDVVNELVVGESTSLYRRTIDSYVTTKVKARLVDETRVSASHIKVVTEDSVVYLMGLVKREEGQIAGEVAARTSGVARVVKVFEYMD